MGRIGKQDAVILRMIMFNGIVKTFASRYADEIGSLIIEMERMSIEERQTIVYAAMNLRLQWLFLKVEICKALIGAK